MTVSGWLGVDIGFPGPPSAMTRPGMAEIFQRGFNQFLPLIGHYQPRRDIAFVQYGVQSGLEPLAAWCARVWYFRKQRGKQ